MEIIIEEAKMYGHLLVIIDEVHRLTKDKQDYLLSYLESGLITLIGATTSNPYHSINPAIRSRCHILKLNDLKANDIECALIQALKSDKGLNDLYTCEDGVIEKLAKLSNGDVRFALNNLELLALTSTDNHITLEDLKEKVHGGNLIFDKGEDGYYNSLSAFQKSIRGSDVNASLYYLARLIEAGDLDSIARRLLVTAYEDVGFGNPNAVDRVFHAIETAKMIGFPEARIPLSFAVIDLALSPKSKSAESSIDKAIAKYNEHPLDVPKYLQLTPEDKNESYPYDRNEIWKKLGYLPSQLKNEKFYDYSLNSNYEKALVENYKNIEKFPREYDLKKLLETK
jgi:putative ATPase